MPLGNDASADFSQTEYRESANAYFKGVDIGWMGFKSYITINALFAALVGALSEHKGTPAANDLVKLIPFFALVATFAVAAVMPHYYKHLENCRLRCEQIEAIHGGKLFTNLGNIAHKGHNLRATGVVVMVLGSIALFWTYFAFKSFYPDTQLGPLLLELKTAYCDGVGSSYWPCSR